MPEITDADLLLHWHYDPAAASNPGVSNTGNLAANVPITPISAAIGGHLPTDVVWEVLPEPVIAFNGNLLAGNAPEDFSLQVLIDASLQVAPWLYLRGAPDLNPLQPGFWVEDAPPVPSMANRGIYAALRAAAGGAAFADVVDIACTYKVTTDFTFTLTPLTTIDQVIDIKWYGKRWDKQTFAKLLAGNALSGTYVLRRPVENMRLSFPLSTPPLSFGTWNQQFGGAQQGNTAVWPFRTTSINTVASTLNTDLALSWSAGASGQAQVENVNENLDFHANPHTDQGGNFVLRVKEYGARSRWQYATGAGTNLRYAAIYVDNDTVHKYHPEHLFLVTDTDNTRVFGIQAPCGPQNGKYRRAPKFDFAVFGDHIKFIVGDNGTGTIQAGQTATHVAGTMITGYPSSATVTRGGAPV
jgi:hypothetical protein